MVPKNENSTKMGIYQDTAELQNRELQRLAILNKYEAYIMKIIAQNQISIINRTYPDNRLSTKFLEYIQSITQFLINYNQTIYQKCSKFPYSSSLMEFLEMYVALEHDSMIKLMKDRRPVEQRVLELLHKMFRHRPKVQKYIVLSVVVNAKNEHRLTRSFCLEFITKTEKEMLWANRNNNLTIGRALLSKVWINPHLKVLTQEYDSSYEDSDLEIEQDIKEERNTFRRKRRKLERPQKQQPKLNSKVHLDNKSASIKKEIVAEPKIERRSWISATGDDLEDVKNVQIKSELSFSETVIKHERTDEYDSSSSVDSYNNRRNARDEPTLGNNNGHFTSSKEDGGHFGGGGRENHSTNSGLICSNVKRDTVITDVIPTECTRHSDISENSDDSAISKFKQLTDDRNANINAADNETNQNNTKAISEYDKTSNLQLSEPSLKSDLSVVQSENTQNNLEDTDIPETSNKKQDLPIQIIVKIALLPEELENNAKAIDIPTDLENSNDRTTSAEIVVDRSNPEENNERKHNLKILEPTIHNQHSELPIEVIVKAVSQPEVKAIVNEKLTESDQSSNKLRLEIDILEKARKNNDDVKIKEVSDEINLESSEIITEDISAPVQALSSQQSVCTEVVNETVNKERILANPETLTIIPETRCDDVFVVPVTQERSELKCLSDNSEIDLDTSLGNISDILNTSELSEEELLNKSYLEMLADTAVSVDDRKFDESVTKITVVESQKSTTELEQVKTIQELESKNQSVDMFEETLNENESLKILTTNSSDVRTPSECTQNIEELNSNLNDGEIVMDDTAVENVLLVSEKREVYSEENKQPKFDVVIENELKIKDVEVTNSEVLKEVDDFKLKENESMEEPGSIEEQQQAIIYEKISNNEILEQHDHAPILTIFNEDIKQTEELKESTENTENISENVIECSTDFDKEIIEENEHFDNSAKVILNDTKSNVSTAEIIDDSLIENIEVEVAIKSNEVVDEIINNSEEISGDKVGEIYDDHLPIQCQSSESQANVDSDMFDIIKERNLDIVKPCIYSDIYPNQVKRKEKYEVEVKENDEIKLQEKDQVTEKGELEVKENEKIELNEKYLVESKEMDETEVTEKENVEFMEKNEIQFKEKDQVEVKEMGEIVVKEIEVIEKDQIDIKEMDGIELIEKDQNEIKGMDEMAIEDFEFKENDEHKLEEKCTAEVKEIDSIELKVKEAEVTEIDENKFQEKDQIEVKELKETNEIQHNAIVQVDVNEMHEIQFKETDKVEVKDTHEIEFKEKEVEVKQMDEIELKEKDQVDVKEVEEIAVAKKDELVLTEKDEIEVQEKMIELEEIKTKVNESLLQDNSKEYPDEVSKLVIEDVAESVVGTTTSAGCFVQGNISRQSYVDDAQEQNLVVSETLNIIEKSNNGSEINQFVDENHKLEDSTTTENCVPDVCETSIIDSNIMGSEFVNFEVEVEIECEEAANKEVVDLPAEIQQTSEEIQKKDVVNPKDDIKKLDESKSEDLTGKDDFTAEVNQIPALMPELTKENVIVNSENNIEKIVKKIKHSLDDNVLKNNSTKTQMIKDQKKSRPSTDGNLMPELKKEIKIDNRKRNRKSRNDDLVVNSAIKVESPKVSIEKQIVETKNESTTVREDEMRTVRKDRKLDKKKYDKKMIQIDTEGMHLRNQVNGRKSTRKENEQLMPTLVKEVEFEKEVSIEKSLDKSRQQIVKKLIPEVKNEPVSNVPKEAKLDFRPDFEKQSKSSPQKSQDTNKMPKELQRYFDKNKTYVQSYWGTKRNVPSIEHILKPENLFSGVKRKSEIFEASKIEHPIVPHFDNRKDVAKREPIVEKPVVKNDELSYKSNILKRVDEKKSSDTSRNRREKSSETKANAKSSYESDSKLKKSSSSTSSKRKHDSKTKEIDDRKYSKRLRSESSTHPEYATKAVEEKHKRHSRSASSEKSISNVKELEKLKKDKRHVESSLKSVDKETEKESSRSLKRKSSSDLKSAESKSRKTSSESKRSSKDRDSINPSNNKSKDSDRLKESATPTTVKTSVVKSKDEMEKTQHENITQVNSITEKSEKNKIENTESKSKKRDRSESSQCSVVPNQENKRHSRSRSLEKPSSKAAEPEKSIRDTKKRDERIKSKRKSVDKEAEKLAKSSPRSSKKKSPSSTELKTNDMKSFDSLLTSKDIVETVPAKVSLISETENAKELVKQDYGSSSGLIPKNEKISYVDQYLFMQREMQIKGKYDKLEDFPSFSEKLWDNKERYSKTHSPKSMQLEVKSEETFRSRSRSIEIDHLKDVRCEEIESDSGVSCLTTTKSMGTITEISEDELNMLEVSPSVPQIDDVKEEPICESIEKQTEDYFNSIAAAEDACGLTGIKVEETDSCMESTSKPPEKEVSKNSNSNKKTEESGKGLETLKSYTESMLITLVKSNENSRAALDKDQMSSSSGVTQQLSFDKYFQTYADFIGDDDEEEVDDIKSQRNRKLFGDLSFGDSLKCVNPSQSQVFDYEPKLYGFESLPCVKDSLVYATDFMQDKVPEEITESQKTVDSLKIIESISMNFAPGKEPEKDEDEEEEEDGSRDEEEEEQEEDEAVDDGEREENDTCREMDDVPLDHTYIKPKLEIQEIPEMVISSDIQIGDPIILDEEIVQDNSSLGVCFNPTRDYSYVENIVNVPSVEHLLSENQFSTSEFDSEFCDVFDGGLELKNISPMKPIEHRYKTPEKSSKVEPSTTLPLPLPRYKRTKVKAPPKKSPNS